MSRLAAVLLPFLATSLASAAVARPPRAAAAPKAPAGAYVLEFRPLSPGALARETLWSRAEGLLARVLPPRREPPPQARPAPETAPWAAAEEWIGSAAGGISSGKPLEWRERVAEILRDDPALSFDGALIRGLADVHRLAPPQRVEAERRLAGEAHFELSGDAKEVFRVAGGVYARTDKGVYRRTDGRWELVLEGRFSEASSDGDAFYVAGNGRIHRVDARGTRVVHEEPGSGLGSLNPVARLAGRSYLPAGDRVLVLGEDGATLDAVLPGYHAALLPAGDRLYAATSAGLFLRGEGGGWTQVLRGDIRHVQAVRDKVLAAGLDGPLWEITGALARPRLEKRTRVMKLFRHDGRLHALIERVSRRGSLFQVRVLSSAGWRTLLETRERLISAFSADRALHVQADRSFFRLKAGRWSSMSYGGFAVPFEHAGGVFLQTIGGVWEAAEDAWIHRHSVTWSRRALSDGRGFLLPTEKGVARIVPEIDWAPWRPALLADLGEALDSRGAPARTEGPADDEGRALFSGMGRAVTSLLGRASAAFGGDAAPGEDSALWRSVEEWTAGRLGIPGPARTGEWRRRVGELLRDRPDMPLEAALARALAEVHSLPPATQRDAVATLSGETSLVSEEMWARELRVRPEGLYAFLFVKGLRLREPGGKWREVGPAGIDAGYGIADAGDVLYAGDGKTIYGISGGRATPALPGAHFTRFVDSGGREYMAVFDKGLFTREDGAWVPVEGFPEASARALLETGGALYAATDGGVYRRDGASWSRVLAGPLVRTLHEADGRLYAGNDWRVIEIEDGAAARPFLNREGGWVVTHAGRAYVYFGKTEELFERRPDGWHPLFSEVKGIFSHGDELVVNVSGGWHQLKDGEWTEHRDDAPGQVLGMLSGLIDHDGRRFGRFATGLYEETPVGWKHVHAWDASPVSLGRSLYFGGRDGVRVHDSGPEGAPRDWRDRLLASLAAETGGRAPAVAGEAGGTDDDGRSLFSGARRLVTGWLGRGAAALGGDAAPSETDRVWAALAARALERLGRAGPDAKLSEWRARAGRALRGRPDADLERTLARAFAETHALTPEEEEAAAGAFSSAPDERAFFWQPPLEKYDSIELLQGTDGAYAATSSGLYRIDPGAPARVRGVGRAGRVLRHGDELYVVDRDALFELRGGEAVRLQEGGRLAWPVLTHEGREHLASFGGVLVREPGGSWEPMTGLPLGGRVMGVAAAAGGLYLSVSNGEGGDWDDPVFLKTPAGWAPIPLPTGGTKRMVEFGGTLHVLRHEVPVKGRAGVVRLYRVDGETASRELEDAGDMHAVAAHGGRLFVTSRGGLYERIGAEWRLLPTGTDRPYAFTESDGRLYAWGNGSAYDLSGPDPVRAARPQGEEFPGRGFSPTAGFGGRTYGVRKDPWKPDVLTVDDSALRFPAEWRALLLESLGAPGGGPSPESSGDGQDDAGRSLFSGLRRVLESRLSRR